MEHSVRARVPPEGAAQVERAPHGDGQVLGGDAHAHVVRVGPERQVQLEHRIVIAFWALRRSSEHARLCKRMSGGFATRLCCHDLCRGQMRVYWQGSGLHAVDLDAQLAYGAQACLKDAGRIHEHTQVYVGPGQSRGCLGQKSCSATRGPDCE